MHTLAVKATNKFEETRDIVKSYINAKLREEIILQRSYGGDKFSSQHLWRKIYKSW